MTAAAIAHADPTFAPHAPACSPLVKWVGGKTSLLMSLHANIPKRFGRYLEPFAGGAALFFSLSPEQAMGAYLGDMNQDLMHCYRMVARDTERVIRRLRWMEREYRTSENRRHYRTSDGLVSYYYAVRAEWNKPGSKDTDVARAARFLFLNRTCFNGVWRVNRQGELNVPQGDYDPTRTICDAERIRACAARLRQARIRTGDFRQLCAEADAGDLVYLDPPYVPLSATASFTGYTQGGFGDLQHRLVAISAIDLVQRGVHVIVSNSNTKLVRELYRDPLLKLRRVHAPRAINCKGSRRGLVRELLIVGTPA